MSADTPSKNPTMDFYGHLDNAFDFFNERLFDGELPKVMFELTHKKLVVGTFTPSSWQATDSQYVHSIALNPQYIAQTTPLVIYLCLIHEQVHLHQHLFGDASRPGYHNKEWGDKMESIGLMPSATGKEGGKRTGQKMSHYLIPGSKTEQACVDFFLQGKFINFVDARIDDADILKFRNKLLAECVRKNESLAEHYDNWQSTRTKGVEEPSEVVHLDIEDTVRQLNIHDDEKYGKHTPDSQLSDDDGYEYDENGDYVYDNENGEYDDDYQNIPLVDNWTDDDRAADRAADMERLGQVASKTPLTTDDNYHDNLLEDALSNMVLQPLEDIVNLTHVPEIPKYDYNKTKYQCPDCKNNLWGKPAMNILCIDCDTAFCAID